jgi:Secretion system C-terminal sorting domain
MKKFYLLIIVLFVNYTISHAQTSSAGITNFIDNIDDVGHINTNHIKVTVFPNPTNGNFNVALGAFKGQEVSVIILDTNGRMAGYRRIEDCKENSSVNFNLSALTKGMYIVKVINGTKLETAKFFVGA